MRSLKKWIKIALYFSPKWLQKRLSEIKEEKDMRILHERSQRTRIEKDELKTIVDSLDIGNCDVMLHTSITNIGRIKGGVKWITQCLLDKFDLNNHTLLVSALPYRGKFSDYLEDNPVFDVRTAPIAMGSINEYIASLSGVERSIHPTHSVICIGKQACEYVSGHHLDSTPFGINSPYYKMIRTRGKIVMFGAKINSLTCIHVVEDLLGEFHPFHVYSRKTYKVDCIDKNGNNITVSTTCHDGLMSAMRDLDCLYDGLLSEKIMSVTKIGESEILIIDAYGFAKFYLRYIADGKTVYGRCRVSKETKNMINTIIDNL